MRAKVCSPFRLSVRAKVGNLHLNWEEVEDVVKLREERRSAIGHKNAFVQRPFGSHLVVSFLKIIFKRNYVV